MSEGFPMFPALTKAPFPAASCPGLDLDALHRRPGKSTLLPVKLVQTHPWIGLLDRHKGQLGPYQADRRRGQTREKLGGRELFRGHPERLSPVALRAPKRCMHQD